ncbi:T9SS type A sorting domain-containing protein, partial [candidate division KSB1 bacterium]|nr:T9SS type A sorting domain-containing protein [candidate division KSB1 bacterium]
VQYEVALDLATSPIKAAPGSVIGFAVWVSDPSVANSFKYGNSFQMPYGALWECAATLDDLALAEQTALSSAENEIQSFFLKQNYPNPFNPKTTINFGIESASHVILKVYDILGKEIRTLVEKDMEAGEYYIPFDAAGLPSGIYMYRIQTEEFSEVRKMILLE